MKKSLMQNFDFCAVFYHYKSFISDSNKSRFIKKQLTSGLESILGLKKALSKALLLRGN